MRGHCVAEGLGFSQIREGVGKIFLVLDVFVPISLNGMTGRARSLVAEEGGRGYRFGRGRSWFVGRLRSQARFCPRGPFSFP
jgi:hypothetical protein